MAESPNLELEIMEESQAGKYLTFNKLLLKMDALTQCVAVSAVLTTAPASPAYGACYIMAGTGGDWAAGAINDIAHYVTGSGWYFYTPKAGWSCYDLNTSAALRFGTFWS
jgi:hypothetical protein